MGKHTQMISKAGQRRTPAEESNEVDPNIVTLIRELDKTMRPALVFLVPEIGRLLAPQLGFLVASILRKMLLCITSINAHGANQIINSIYALVSVVNMDGFISEDETEAILTMVHPYFSILCSKSPHKDILMLIENQGKPPNFHLDEIEVLFKRTNNERYYSADTAEDQMAWDDIKNAFVAKVPDHMEKARIF